jgi:adenylate kinase
LQRECNVVHLSSGDLLRQEVEKQSPLGKMVKDIMSRGELVSSAIMVALMKKRMKDHPGKQYQCHILIQKKYSCQYQTNH